MNRTRLYYIFALLCMAQGCWAQGPNDTGKYYKPATGKSGAELKTALHQIIRDPMVVTYAALKYAYPKTDVLPSGYLRDWYSCVTKYEPGSNFGQVKAEGNGYNREHLMPQSWFQKQDPMVSDIMHVVPTDAYLNSRRNDYPFSEVDSTVVFQSQQGYSKLGFSKSIPYKARVFEPNDEVKGDIARVYFYMVTCYEDQVLGWTYGTGAAVIDSLANSHQPLHQWVMDQMLRWSQQDPVDSLERARNEAVQGVQGNRNPFVDYPGLEQYVWGGKIADAFSYDYYDGIKQSDIDDTPDPVDDEPQEAATSCTIALNNKFFGVSWNGSRPDDGEMLLTGTQNGITVTYAKGAGGQYMYCNSSQIRLYQKNTLTIHANKADLTQVVFKVKANVSEKELLPTTGAMDGYTWSGKTPEVTFTVTEGTGNIQLTSITVDVEQMEEQGIATSSVPGGLPAETATYDLQGRKVDDSHGLPRGIYIRNGRKFIVK